MMNASFPDLTGEHRTEPVPPVPDRLVADIDTTLEQDILYLPQRQRITDIPGSAPRPEGWRSMPAAAPRAPIHR